MTTDSKKFAEQIAEFSEEQRVRFFHLLLKGICLHARGLASNESVPADVRLLQSEAIIEMIHRTSEQMDHYFKRDDAQRPDEDLFDLLYSLESKVRLGGIVSSAAGHAVQKLQDGA